MTTAALHANNPHAMRVATNTGPRPQLRRAVYIHVSDLTNAYNIDHARLEEELIRVQSNRDKPSEPSSSRFGVPTELDTSASQKRLQPPRGGYNLCVLVGKVEVVVDKYRVDGSRVRLAEVEVGDETGTVSLRARDEQIDGLTEVSQRAGAVVLRNCTLELYQGKHIRLAITKWGKLNSFPDQIASTPPPPSKMNHDRNFSLIDLSMVASEMASDPYRSTEADSHNSSIRQQSYPPAQPRRGQGRKSSTLKMQTGASVVSHHYPTSASAIPMPYSQGNLHGYGYTESMEPQPYTYHTRPHERMTSAQQQQLMMQQHYEMQQHQLQQMYQHASQGRQQMLSSQPIMIAPGLQATSSFDTVPETSPFLTSGHGAAASPKQQSQSNPTLRSDSPQSQGKMNPQAATYDPPQVKPSEK